MIQAWPCHVPMYTTPEALLAPPGELGCQLAARDTPGTCSDVTTHRAVASNNK